jgi:hypothetical protein
LVFAIFDHSHVLHSSQDRYTLVRDLAPDPAADWAHKAVPDVPRSFLAVFDGHKRCESADMASKRMAPMLARWLLHPPAAG